MHVGVKEAVAQRVAQKTLDHIAAECCQVKALRLKRAMVTQRQPSIQSSVSTSRAVRSQSTVGTRKSASSRVLSAISEARQLPAGNPFRSQPNAASVDTTSINRSRAPPRRKLRLCVPRRRKHPDRTLNRRSMPGRRTLTATGLRASVYSELPRDALVRSTPRQPLDRS